MTSVILRAKLRNGNRARFLSQVNPTEPSQSHIECKSRRFTFSAASMCLVTLFSRSIKPVVKISGGHDPISIGRNQRHARPRKSCKYRECSGRHRNHSQRCPNYSDVVIRKSGTARQSEAKPDRDVLHRWLQFRKVSDGFPSADLRTSPCSTAEISVTFLMYQNRPVRSEASVLS